VPKTIPLSTPTVRDAYLEHAARLVHGYYEMRSGKLHFEIAVEDATNHRMLGTAAEDGQPEEAINRAAKSLAAGAREFPASPAAATAWGQGDFERAVALDPGFALAWLGWAQKLSAGGDNPGALEVLQRALTQPELDSSPALNSKIDTARLELAAATLRQDDGARLEATRKLAQLIPYDPALLSSLGELDMAARNFAAAAQDYQLARQADPADFGLFNSLGYAQALAGNIDEARKAFEEYGRGPGEDAVNALDSLGEALFVNGKFDEAERQFLDAYKKDPKFLEGDAVWKAAHARWLASYERAGNLEAANRIADQYFQDRAKARDPLLTWRRANWLYETGRRQQAVDLLMHAPENNPTAAAVAKQQLEVWNNPQPVTTDLGKLEEAYRRADPVNDGLPRVLYAEALLRAGRKKEARDLLQRWPLPVREESTLQSLLYPKYLELRKSLD
jgi:tetratricopeptide (TPR) repeat protein